MMQLQRQLVFFLFSSLAPGPMADSFSEIDMIMFSLFNSREREEADWRMLFHEADKRFKDIKIWVPEGATMAIIEASWEGRNGWVDALE